MLGRARKRQHKHSVDHMKHCWDYLRQALLCYADDTLEPLREEGRPDLPGVNGWGVEHKCRDFDELMRWTARHRATNEGGIL